MNYPKHLIITATGTQETIKVMSSDCYQYFFSLTVVHLDGVTGPDQFAGCHSGCTVLYLCKWQMLSVFSMAKIQVGDLRPNPANPSLHVSHLFWVKLAHWSLYQYMELWVFFSASNICCHRTNHCCFKQG